MEPGASADLVDGPEPIYRRELSPFNVHVEQVVFVDRDLDLSRLLRSARVVNCRVECRSLAGPGRGRLAWFRATAVGLLLVGTFLEGKLDGTGVTSGEWYMFFGLRRYGPVFRGRSERERSPLRYL